MTISANKVVTLDYTLTDDQGEVLDQSQNGQFAYLHGASNIIPGLENALTGKTEGERLNVKVSPEQGYGVRDESLSQVVGMEMFESPDQVQVGQQFHAQSGDGNRIVITVTNIDGDQVTIDGNHPLAGITLNFDVTVVNVRDATQQELEHQHVHAHGHDH
ncbi:MAG: peptidylprolyl isomerase [Gammaproteobacteria bacterium]|nr:peptidylprolyl isomerase [Gammaproteobacteria bacterium]